MTPRFIPGAVYESKTHGLVEFKGIDRYMGQASLRFYSVDHDQTCYWLPSALDLHFGTTQETSPVQAVCDRAAHLADVANVSKLTPQEMELAGRNAYDEHIDSSGIHSNRFPSWGELMASEREAWISKALNREVTP